MAYIFLKEEFRKFAEWQFNTLGYGTGFTAQSPRWIQNVQQVGPAYANPEPGVLVGVITVPALGSKCFVVDMYKDNKLYMKDFKIFFSEILNPDYPNRPAELEWAEGGKLTCTIPAKDFGDY